MCLRLRAVSVHRHDFQQIRRGLVVAVEGQLSRDACLYSYVQAWVSMYVHAFSGFCMRRLLKTAESSQLKLSAVGDELYAATWKCGYLCTRTLMHVFMQ